jgi:hypothetical protein
MKRKSITAEELDRLVDEGKEDVLQYFDLAKARRPNQEIKRINLDLPVWMIAELDYEARQRGVTRQSVIKTWIFEKIRENTVFVTDEEDRVRKRARQVAEPRARYRAKKGRR